MKALLHTPGIHSAVLIRADVRISPARNHHLIRLCYRHTKDYSATLNQHIIWATPNTDEVPELGAYIMSKIFSRMPAGNLERNTSFWLRQDIKSAVDYLQKFCHGTFEVTVESRTNPETKEVYPKLKLAYYCQPTHYLPKGA